MRARAHSDQVFRVYVDARKNRETINPGSSIEPPVDKHDLTELIETDGTTMFVFAVIVRFVAALPLFIDIHDSRFTASL